MKRLNFIGGLLVGVSIVFIFIYIGKQRSDLSVKGKYTVGVTQGRQGKFITTKLVVDEREYTTNHDVLKYDPKEREGRYFMKFLPSDPEVNEIYWDKPVPDCIGNIPPKGWEEIPKCK